MITAITSLFSVEALDTRVEPPSDEKRQAVVSRAGPDRWNTWEYRFYLLMFLIFVPLMCKAPYDVSKPSSPNYSKFEHLLSPGWMGRPVDNSDLQYQGFRDNFPSLIVVAVLHFLLRAAASQFRVPRVTFDAVFGVLYITGLHGFSVVKVLILFAVNVAISRLEVRIAKPLTWAFNVGILFSNELLRGYPMALISPSLEFLDHFGVMPHWEVFFKCCVLRMISFNMDYFDAVARSKSGWPSPEDKHKQNEETLRITTPRALSEYSFNNFVGYCLYAPLYIAGPILSFNDYMSQSEKGLNTINWKRTTRYAVRFAICMLCMEFIMHYTYVVAISSVRAWNGSTPFQISMIALFNLAHIWLKLLIPWRYFRLWALVDGIDPPENMIRCVANNYSAMSFWRAWHRSFHKWVVRYLYIPLGGNSNPVLNNLVVFTFVALWHDIQLRLLIWGWLVVFFVLPEIIAGRIFPAKKYGSQPWYRHLCAVGGVANVWMMMIANLVGFAVGVDGIRDMLHDMVHTLAGLQFVIISSMLLFVGVQVMFEVRENEKRKGIDLKC